MEVEYPTV